MELDPAAWGANWAWGIPLIMLTTVVHVLGLGLISERIVRTLQHRMDHRRFTWLFAMAMSVVILMATLLHAFEAALWAIAYLLLGAMPNWGYSSGWGYGPSGIVGVILVILIILVLLGRI